MLCICLSPGGCWLSDLVLHGVELQSYEFQIHLADLVCIFEKSQKEPLLHLVMFCLTDFVVAFSALSYQSL